MTEEQRNEDTTEDTENTPFRAFKTEDEYKTHLKHVTQERAERAKTKAVNDLLEKLELEDEDTLAEVVSDYRTIQEATQSETEQIEERARKAEKKQTELKETMQTVEAERDEAKERTETLEGLVSAFVTPRLEQLPEHYRELLDEWPVEKQAAWLTKNADKLTETGGNGGVRPAGSRPTGRAQTLPKGEADKEAREQQRRARVSAI